MRKILSIFAIATALSISSKDASSQSSDEVLVQRLHLNPRVEQTFFDNVLKQGTTQEGKLILSALATAFGAPPAVIGVIKLAPKVKSPGEEHFIDIPKPRGYTICKGETNIRSAIPAKGIKSPSLNVCLYPSKAYVYAATPLRSGGGQTAVDMILDLMFVRNDVRSEYSCVRIPKSGLRIRNCRGTSCTAPTEIRGCK